MRIPSDLLPVCPHCGKPMKMNLRADNSFVEDTGWHTAADRYRNFLRTRQGRRVLFLELGVGYNTPVLSSFRSGKCQRRILTLFIAASIIAMLLVQNNIQQQSICIDEDIGIVLDDL